MGCDVKSGITKSFYSSGNCCFSSGEELSSTKNKQTEVGEAMRSSSKQNKNKNLGDLIHHQSFIMWSTSLRVAKAGNLRLDFMAKSIRIHFYMLQRYQNLQKNFWLYGQVKSSKHWPIIRSRTSTKCNL